MKKIITMLITLCMVVALAVPAFALEYEIDGPGYEYGEDTSIEVVYTNEPDMNVDASKNAALVPPCLWERQRVHPEHGLSPDPESRPRIYDQQRGGC